MANSIVNIVSGSIVSELMNVNEMLVLARIAPPCEPAELLMKLLVPLKVSATFHNAQIAPPLYPVTWLPIKLLVPVKLSTIV